MSCLFKESNTIIRPNWFDLKNRWETWYLWFDYIHDTDIDNFWGNFNSTQLFLHFESFYLEIYPNLIYITKTNFVKCLLLINFLFLFSYQIRKITIEHTFIIFKTSLTFSKSYFDFCYLNYEVILILTF